MSKRIVHLHIIRHLHYFGKRLTDRFSKVYNPLNKLVRRINLMKREFLLVAFGLCVGAFILVIQFFVNPLNWVSPIKWQWLVAVVVIVLVVGMTIYIIRGVRKIDKDNETKQVAMLKKALESNNAKLAKAIGKALVEAGLAKREANRGKRIKARP